MSIHVTDEMATRNSEMTGPASTEITKSIEIEDDNDDGNDDK